jgi:hypothetical protein
LHDSGGCKKVHFFPLCSILGQANPLLQGVDDIIGGEKIADAFEVGSAGWINKHLSPKGQVGKFLHNSLG